MYNLKLVRKEWKGVVTITVPFQDIETTIVDPDSVFLSTHR